MNQMKVLLGISLAALVAVQPALADSTASVNTSSSSSSSSSFDQFLKKARANYSMEVIGANVRALSGNTAGAGTALQINHYPSIGYRIGGKWNVMFTQAFTQNIDEVENGAVGAPRAFDATDPYISLNNSRIMGANALNFKVSSQLRYYAPVSRGTRNAANNHSATEAGRGRIRALLNPSITMMDGAFEITAPTYLFVQWASSSDAERLAANGSSSRRNIRFLPSVIPGYQVSKNVQAYLEMGALFNHFTNKSTDSWSKIDDKGDGFYLSPGANIDVGKKLSLNVAAYVGPFAFDVKKSSLYFSGTYTFL